MEICKGPTPDKKPHELQDTTNAGQGLSSMAHGRCWQKETLQDFVE